MAGGFPLDTRVELGLDGWVDVTSRVYARDPISITRGRSADSSSTDPASCRFTLDNRDQAFSMRNPMSPYYGLLRRNIPVRVSVPATRRGLTLRYNNPLVNHLSKATADDPGTFNFTAGLDVRVELDADQWERGHLIGKYIAEDGKRDWAFIVENGGLTLLWSPDGLFASRVFADSGRLFDGSPAHRAVAAALVFDDGSGKWRVTFSTAATLAGPWTVVATAAPKVAGTTHVNHGIAGIDAGAITGYTGNALPGRLVRAEVRNGTTLVASPDFAAQAPGTLTFPDAQGATWRVRDDAEITDRDVRFYGEVSQWPQSRDVAGVDKTIAITAYGIRRRLSFNAPPIDSVMVREFASPRRANIVAYWPMEDAEGATLLASAFPGAPPLRTVGAPRIAAYSDLPSSKPLPYMGAGAFIGNVPSYDTSTGEFSVRFFMDMDAKPAAISNLLTVRTTTMVWDVDTDNSGNLRVRALSTDEDTVYHDSGWWAYGLQNYGFLSMSFEVYTSGTAVGYSLLPIDFQSDQVWNQAIPTLGSISATVAGRKVGRATQITIGRDKTLGDVAIGHLAVANLRTAYANTGGALNVWNGEMAEERLSRLATEDGVTVRVADGGTPAGFVNGHRMGDQVADTWLALLEQVEAADLGWLVESRDELSFVYRSRWGLTNQAATVSLDYDAGEIAGELQPVDDDDALVNDVTVKRTDGGAYRVDDEVGPLSVLPPPFGVGRYADEVEISAQSDEWLPAQAGFRLRMGTVDEARYPTLSVDLHGPRVSDDQAARVRRLDIGDRIDIANADAWTANVPQMVTGYTEELQVATHRFAFNLTPYEPWTAAVVETDRYDTAGSELAAPAAPPVTAPDFVDVDSVYLNLSSIAVPPVDGAFVAVVLAWNTLANITAPAGWTLQKILDESSARAALFTAASADVTGWTFTLTDPTSGAPLISKTSAIALGYTASAVTAMNGIADAGTDNVHEAPALTIPAGPVRLVRFYWDKSSITTTWTANDPGATVRRTQVGVGSGTTSAFATDQVVVTAGTVPQATATADVANMNAGGFSLALYSTAPPVDPGDGGVSATDTALTVATTLGPRWTTSPADFPLDVMLGGERVTVLGITGTDPTGQTFTVTRSVNGVVKAHPAGTTLALADPAYTTL